MTDVKRRYVVDVRSDINQTGTICTDWLSFSLSAQSSLFRAIQKLIWEIRIVNTVELLFGYFIIHTPAANSSKHKTKPNSDTEEKTKKMMKMVYSKLYSFEMIMCVWKLQLHCMNAVAYAERERKQQSKWRNRRKRREKKGIEGGTEWKKIKSTRRIKVSHDPFSSEVKNISETHLITTKIGIMKCK